MSLTPSIKGQLTKARNASLSPSETFNSIRRIFEKHMPREQAKHASRKYLASLS